KRVMLLLSGNTRSVRATPPNGFTSTMPFDGAGLITATSFPLAGNTAAQLCASLIAAANGSDGSGAGGTDVGAGSPTVAEKPTEASKNKIEMDASPSACHGLGPLNVADRCTPASTSSPSR